MPLRHSPTLGIQLRQLRLAQGHSLRALAKLARCSASFLNQIELGKTSPTMESLELICHGLGLTVVQFLQTVEEQTNALRLPEQPSGRVVSDWGDAVLRHYLPPHVGSAIAYLILDLAPRAKTPWRAAHRSTRELALLLFGSADFLLYNQKLRLKPRESIHLDLMAPHRWINPTSRPARIMLINPNFTDVYDLPERNA